MYVKQKGYIQVNLIDSKLKTMKFKNQIPSFFLNKQIPGLINSWYETIRTNLFEMSFLFQFRIYSILLQTNQFVENAITLNIFK